MTSYSSSTPSRKIIHIDMDCFFASIEILKNPSFKLRPLAVGSSPQKRGVIATCNYPARKYGVHSAMSSAYALKLCPDLKIIPSDFELYKEYSRKIMQILKATNLPIEICSLDEAYIDATNLKAFKGSATLLANSLRQKIFEQTSLTCSTGIAPNKFLAKVASDWNKPNGTFTIAPEHIQSFLMRLDIAKIPGVGKVNKQKLNELGIKNCHDLNCFGENKLIDKFHSFGSVLYQFSKGLDTRPLVEKRKRKSLSCESTFSTDLKTLLEMNQRFSLILDELIHRLHLKNETTNSNELNCISSFFIKVKFDNFETVTASRTLNLFTKNRFLRIIRNPNEIKNKDTLESFLQKLLAEAYYRKERPVRLIGAGVKLNEPNIDNQLNFFDKLSLSA